MFLLDLLQELVLLLTPTFLAVFSLLVQHGQQEAAGTNFVQLQVLLSAVVSVQTKGREDQLGVSPSGQAPGLI